MRCEIQRNDKGQVTVILTFFFFLTDRHLNFEHFISLFMNIHMFLIMVKISNHYTNLFGREGVQLLLLLSTELFSYILLPPFSV